MGKRDGDRPELQMIVVDSDLHGSSDLPPDVPHAAAGSLPPPQYCQSAPAISRIFVTASSIVKLLGFWIGGKSVNVSAQREKIDCDAWMM